MRQTIRRELRLSGSLSCSAAVARRFDVVQGQWVCCTSPATHVSNESRRAAL